MYHLRRAFCMGVSIVIVSGLASAAAYAAALPEFLSAFPNKYKTLLLGSAVLETSGAVTPSLECLKSEGKGEVLSLKKGSFDELFLECKAIVGGIQVICQGLTDTSLASVLVTGKYTIGYQLGTKNPVVAQGLGEVHYECSMTLFVVKGCFANVVNPKNVSTTKEIGTATTKALEDYTNDTGKTIPCELLTSIGGTTFKLSTFNVALKLSFETEIEVMA